MAETPQQVIARLKLTNDRNASYKKLNDIASDNAFIINKFGGILDALKQMPESTLKSKTGLSKKDISSFEEFRRQVIVDVAQREPDVVTGLGTKQARYLPGQAANVAALREGTKQALGEELAPISQISKRGLGGDIAAFGKGAVGGFLAPYRAAELSRRGMDVSPAFETPKYDVAAQQGAGFGYGYGQNFGPTAASIPGLVAGGGLAGALDKATSKFMPNNPILNLLRVGGVVGGSMLGAQGTSAVYDKFMGPYAGLSEDQRKTVGGVGGRMLGGPSEQLGKFGATATIFGAPALDPQNKVALFEGAGLLKSFKAITRDANALRDPAVKEFVGDFGERVYSVATSAQEVDKNNKERIQSFIQANGRVPTRDEKDAMGVLSNAEKLTQLLPDIVFGGMTRFGKGFSPETGYNALGDIASGIQARRDARQTTGAQIPGMTAVTPGTATMGAPTATGRALNINIQLPSGNGFKPYRITFDQTTGMAQIIEPKIHVPATFGIPISNDLARKPPVTVGNTTFDIRGVTKDGDFIVLSTDKVTGAQSLETKSFNELPDAWKPTVERTFKDTVIGGQRKNINTLPTDVSYNPQQDALKAYADTYKTKINIDGTEVNAAVTAIDGNMVTVRLPSGNQFTLPKSFFPDPDNLKVDRMGSQIRKISGYKNKIDGVEYAAAETFNGADYFIPEVNRKQVKANPGIWGALFSRIPDPASQFQPGTVLDLGALNGEQQVGIVLGFEQFDINGQPSGGYKVKLLNDPRVDSFYVPSHSTITPIDPSNNPFVTGGAPVAPTSTPAVVPPVPPTAPAGVSPAVTSTTTAPVVPSAPSGPVLPQVPTINAPLTSGVTLAEPDYRRIVVKIKQYIATALADGSMPAKGDLDVNAIALAINESADDVDAAVERLMKDGILREEGGVFDFEGLNTYLAGYAYARPDETSPLTPAATGTSVAASPENGVPVDTAGQIEFTKAELEKGPLTKTGLANKLKIKTDEALSILEGLEAEGVIESFKNGNRPGTYYRLVPAAPEAAVAPTAPAIPASPETAVTPTSPATPASEEGGFSGSAPEGGFFGEAPTDGSEPVSYFGEKNLEYQPLFDDSTPIEGAESTSTVEEPNPFDVSGAAVEKPLVPATREPRPATEKTDIPKPEEQAFPYGNEFEQPAAPGTLPVEMEDYREGDTRYRRQTGGEETKRFTVDDFRRAVPRWASGAGGFSKFVGKFILPLVDRYKNQGFLEIQARGVSNKQELQVALQDVFGQTQEQSAALSEWVDRFSLGWAREFARLHGIGTMERLRAVRLSTDPSIDLKKLVTNHDTWKRYYREQMLPVHSEENAQVLRALQTIFYTERLGVLSKMSTEHQAMLNGATGMTFSINGDGRRVVNVVMSLYGKENYNTQVHEINHALVRAMYAPMIHELASKYYQTYVQNNNAKKNRVIQKDLEERIVTELTNMMFNSPEAGDYNFFADNEHVEGGFDTSLNALILNIGSEMRKSIEGLPEDNPNNLAVTKHWEVAFPNDVDARQEINKGTPLIIEQDIPFVGRRRKTVFLAERIKPGEDITVQDGYRDPKTGEQKYKNRRKIPQSDVLSIGQMTVTGLEPAARQYFVRFMGHWYDYTVGMINKYTDDVDVSIDNFEQVQVADVKRLTVGYKWFDTVDDAKKEVGAYADWPDTRIEYRTSESYLGWADKGGYEVYLKGQPGQPTSPRILEEVDVADYLQVALVPGFTAPAPADAIAQTAVADVAAIESMSVDEILAKLAEGASGGIPPALMNTPLPKKDDPKYAESNQRAADSIFELVKAFTNVEGKPRKFSDRKYQVEVSKLLMNGFMRYVNGIVLANNRDWLGTDMSLYQKSVEDVDAYLRKNQDFLSKVGRGRKDLNQDVVQEVYIGAYEAISNFASKARPVTIVDAEGNVTVVPNVILYPTRDANGNVVYQEISTLDVWSQLKRDIIRTSNSNVTKLRQSEGAKEVYANADLRTAFFHMANDPEVEGEYEMPRAMRFDDAQVEQVRRAAAIQLIRKANRNVANDKFVKFTTVADVITKHRQMRPALKTKLLEILDGVTRENVNQKVFELENFIRNAPELRTGQRAVDSFRGIHTPVDIKGINRTTQRDGLLLFRAQEVNGKLTIVMPYISRDDYNKAVLAQERNLSMYLLQLEASQIVSLDQKLGSDEGTGDILDIIGVKDKSIEDVNIADVRETMYKDARLLEAFMNIVGDKASVRNFYRGADGQVLYEARRKALNPRTRREPLLTTITTAAALEAQIARGVPLTAVQKATLKRAKDVITEFEKWADEKAESVSDESINKLIGIAIDATSSINEDTKTNLAFGLKAKAYNDILKQISGDAESHVFAKHVVDTIENQIFAPNESRPVSESYMEMYRDLTPIQAVILERRRLQLQTVGINPPGMRDKTLTKSQVTVGINIGDPKYNAANQEIITRLNAIEGNLLQRTLSKDVHSATGIKAVLKTLDTLISKIEAYDSGMADVLEGMTQNEKRLHLLVERQEYNTIDENGAVVFDKAFAQIAGEMRSAPWMAGTSTDVRGNPVTFAAAMPVKATIQALFESSVIPPTTLYKTGFDITSEIVTTETLKPVTDDTILKRAQSNFNANGKPVPIFDSLFASNSRNLYETALLKLNIPANANTVLTDDQLRQIVGVNAEGYSDNAKALAYDRLVTERDEYIVGGLKSYLESQQKSLQAMTIGDLNGYLATMDSNEAFASMSSIMNILTNERSALLPFVVYAGRLPEKSELNQIIQQYAQTRKISPKKAAELVTGQYKSLEQNVAQFGLEYMTRATMVTRIQHRNSIENGEAMQFLGLTLNASPKVLDAVNADMREHIISASQIFGDASTRSTVNNFSLIHTVLKDIKDSRQIDPNAPLTPEQKRISDIYDGFVSRTDALVPRKISDLVWIGRPDRKTQAVPKGLTQKREYGQVPESIFVEAVRKRASDVIKNVVNEIRSTDDEEFTIFRKATRGKAGEQLVKIINDPNEANKPENQEWVARLKVVTEAVAADMIEARAEIARALNDPSLNMNSYEGTPTDNGFVVTVKDSSGKPTMEINYSNNSVKFINADGTMTGQQFTPRKKDGLTRTQNAIIYMLSNVSGQTEEVVTPEMMEGLSTMPDAVKMQVIERVKLSQERFATFKNRIENTVKSMNDLGIMPAEYWHGRDRVEVPTLKAIEPMFMNRELKTAREVNDRVGTRDPQTMNEYVKPVVNKWIQPDENGNVRVQLDQDGVPAWDGYGYTVQTAEGARSMVYQNLRLSGLSHHKALEIYALTEHPEFKAWQQGDLIESVHLNDPGSYLTRGVPVTAEVKDKLRTVTKAHRLMTAIDDYNTSPNSENFENLKYHYDELLGFDKDGRPLTQEQLDKKVSEFVGDSIQLEAVRVQADTILTDVNTRDVQIYSNPILAHTEGQKKLKTGSAFTTLAFGMNTPGLFSFDAPGVRMHDLGSGLHKNNNITLAPRWIKMSNPLIVDLQNSGIDLQTAQKHVAKALQKGHDGIVFTNYADSMFSGVTRNVAMTLNDSNIKSVATMHVASNAKRPAATVKAIEPMFMNRPLMAPVTKLEAPELLAEGMEEVVPEGKDIAKEVGLAVYDNFQAFARAALSLDFAFTFIQGGRAALGLVSGRPMDSWFAIQALFGSMAGLAPNTSITIAGKKIGFDKLGRRAYMNVYLNMRKDPMWQVMKDLKVPLHMMNLERRLENERDKLYRQAGGAIAYEDIPMDLMEYDERGNLVDFFEKNTIIGAFPLQGMFERQISLQHDLLLFSLIKHQLTTNPVLAPLPPEELATNKYAKVAANYCALSLGDFQYSTDEKIDAKWGRAGKLLFVAPRWLFSNILLNPIINQYISNDTGVRSALAKVMGEDNRIFDLVPKNLHKENKELDRYIKRNYWWTMMYLLGAQAFAELRGIFTKDGGFDAQSNKWGAYRAFKDWKISDSTGTFDLVNVPTAQMMAFFGGNPGQPDRGKETTAGKWFTHFTNVLGYRASPVITKVFQAFTGRDVLNRPVWAKDEDLQKHWNDVSVPLLRSVGVNVPRDMKLAVYWSSQMPTAWQENWQAYGTALDQYKTPQEAKAAAVIQLITSSMGLRVKYDPYVPYERMKFERRRKYLMNANQEVPKLTDLVRGKNFLQSIKSITEGK